MCVPQAWRDLGGTSCKLCGLFSASRDCRVMRECVVNRTVFWTNRESGGDFRFEVLVLQIQHRSFQRVRFERTRIDLQRLFDIGRSFVELTGFKCNRGLECNCFDETRVDSQCLRECCRCFGVAIQSLVACEIEKCTGAVWIDLESIVEKECGVAIRVFFSEQLTGAELCFEVIRILLDC